MPTAPVKNTPRACEISRRFFLAGILPTVNQAVLNAEISPVHDDDLRSKPRGCMGGSLGKVARRRCVDLGG